MKRFLIPLIALFILLVTVLVGAFWWRQNTRPVSAQDSSVRFVITKGESASETGVKLQKEGLIMSPLAFKFYVQARGLQSRIQAGQYTLSPTDSLFEIADQLVKGPLEIWVTIPEGLRKEEIAEKFATSLGKNEEFIKEFDSVSKDSEGFLFPDTYLFPKTASASAVVNKLTTTFDSKYNTLHTLLLEKDAAGGLDNHGIVTLASILERETKTEEERPIVAGILLKRLEKGWPLQADATVQYAKATAECKMQSAKCEWWPKLGKGDFEIDSSYNTYKFKGLPPWPIANPGLSSLKAVITADLDTEYWYYIHDSEGKIHYAKTLEEHNQNIETYLND